MSNQKMSEQRFFFKKKDRLLTSEQFKNVFDQQNASKDSFFVVLIKRNDLSYSRLGMVISKKSFKLAHQRNTIKRVIRESFRVKQDFSMGLDIVIISRKPSSFPSNEMIFNSLKNHWKKVDRLCLNI